MTDEKQRQTALQALAWLVRELPDPARPTMQVIAGVLAERARQDRKWGRQDHPPVYWIGILTEELGEAAREAIEIEPMAERGERSPDESLVRLRQELVQLAAVAVAAIEAIDRIPIEDERRLYGGARRAPR